MSDDRSPIYSNLAGDPEIGEIIVMYAEEMPDRAARLRATLESWDRDELQEISHQIKGSAGSHGFQTITAAAAELNHLVKTQGSEDQIIEKTEKLIDMCLRATGKPKQ